MGKEKCKSYLQGREWPGTSSFLVLLLMSAAKIKRKSFPKHVFQVWRYEKDILQTVISREVMNHL